MSKQRRVRGGDQYGAGNGELTYVLDNERIGEEKGRIRTVVAKKADHCVVPQSCQMEGAADQ